MYEILFAAGLSKRLKGIPKADQKMIMKKIEKLANNPFPSGCKALQGSLSGYHRIRSGCYRIVYNVDSEKIIIFVLRIGHRSSIYH